jgi:two-component system alkaline phosphatase synthesis response regulator PhoP
MARILVADDEPNFLDSVKLILELENHEVVTAVTGGQAIKTTQQQHFDLIILDVMMPEIDGISVCEQFRLHNRSTPIILFTAKDSPSDRLLGLKRGANDYVSKSSTFEEIILRVNNLLSLTYNTSGALANNDQQLYSFGGNSINFKTYTAVTFNNSEINLTPKEVKFLKLLTERQNEVISRHTILQLIWGYDVYPSTRSIDNFIVTFRRYFEPTPQSPQYFHSVRGIGYKFTP